VGVYSVAVNVLRKETAFNFIIINFIKYWSIFIILLAPLYSRKGYSDNMQWLRFCNGEKVISAALYL